MSPRVAYDEIADWYEHEFLGAARGLGEHPLGIDSLVTDLLGPGEGPCLDIGCGTGEWAATTAALGRRPIGVDLSAAMLGYARERLTVVRGDAARLPFRDGSMAAVVSVMAHTDMPAYPRVLTEVERVLRPGGPFLHVGVHPCFCGGFADRTDRAAIVVRRAYLDGSWTTPGWSDHGVMAKVGETHRPLPALLNAVLGAGLALELFAEGGAPIPTVLAFRARKPAAFGAEIPDSTLDDGIPTPRAVSR